MKYVFHQLALVLILMSLLPANGQYVVTDLNSTALAPTMGLGVLGSFQVGTGTLAGQPQALCWQNTSASAVNLTPSGYSKAYAFGTPGPGGPAFVVGEGVTTAGKTVALTWGAPTPTAAQNINPTVGGTSVVRR